MDLFGNQRGGNPTGPPGFSPGTPLPPNGDFSGRIGIVSTALSAAGRVIVDGIELNAICVGAFLPVGQRIKIIEKRMLYWVVEPC